MEVVLAIGANRKGSERMDSIRRSQLTTLFLWSAQCMLAALLAGEIA